MPHELRPYQEGAIRSLRESLRSGHRRPILSMATGTGKTAVAGAIFQMSRAKGHRILFVVPAISLIDQTINSFWDDGIREVGVIQADHPMTDYTQPVQIASAQTLIRREKPNVDLVIVDEAHIQFKAMNEWLCSEEMKNIPVIGLSATPWAKGMAKVWDDLIICATTKQMIEQGYLSDFIVYAPSHPDLSKVKTVAGDYHEGQLAETMNKPSLVADVVETWIKLGEGRRTLCFAVGCAHAQSLQQRFEESGIPCGYVDAYTPLEERLRIRDKLHRKEYRVVCNVGTLTTGVDWKIECISLCRPTKSEILFVQIIGRGLRLDEDGKNLIILDHSNTTNTLGFVTEILHDKLDDGKPKEAKKQGKESLPKECPKCHNLRPPKVPICPICGFQPESHSKIETADGELVEIKRKGKGKEKGPPNCVRIGGVWIPFGEFYGQLKRHAVSRGYKTGWASQQYRELVGTWPNSYSNVPEIPVSYEVQTWIKSRLIRFSKRKAKEQKPASPNMTNDLL